MKIAIGCFIGLMLSVSIGAESLLEGRVRLDSGEPIADAQVRLFDLTDLRRGAIARALTDDTGYFALPLAELAGRVLPERFALGPNYPNPFNPSTIIPYQLAASSEVRLEVFNLLGQRIATLVDGVRPAGLHSALWNATDATGRAVGAGVYIYRMTVGMESQTGRMVLVDGQAGISAAGAASVMPGVSGGEEGAQVYGLLVSGSGLVPYVDSSFRVEAGMVPVELVVSEGSYSAGKVAGDCDLCNLFDMFNNQQEEEEDEAEEEETESTSSEGGPDLIVQSPSASAVVLTPGQAFTLHVIVQNQGDQQAAATMLHYYRSNNTTITASDTKVGTGAVDTLDASATSEQSIELTASVGVERYYGACVESVSGESNTDNNCSSAVKITVSGQEETEDSTETETYSADSTTTTQADDTEGPEGSVQVTSTSVEVIDASQRFNIELVFADNISSEDRDVFRRAAQDWERVILSDLPDVVLERTFYETNPTIVQGREVDDLLVVVYQKEPGNSLAPFFYIEAFAQLFLARPGGLSVLGQVTYGEDSRRILTEIHEERSEFYATGNRINGYPPYAPVDELVEQDMYTMALHEIGHVLGVGTLDQWFDYIKPAAYWDNPLPYNIIGNPFPIQFFYLSNTYAWEGFLRLRRVFEAHFGSDSGAFLYYGEAIPLDDRRSHWGRMFEADLDVMSVTSNVLAPNGTTMPQYISPLTRGALKDLGYEVEMSIPIYDVTLEGLRPLPEPAAGKLTLSRPTFICRVGH